MRILDRYVGRSVAVGVAGVMAVLLALYAFIEFIQELEKVGRGTYDAAGAAVYTLAQLPSAAYEFFPLAALLGSLLGLGTLAGHSELTAVRAAGVSILRIVGAVLKTGIVLMLIAFVLGEVLAPPVTQYAANMRVKLLAKQISLNTRQGLWAREGDTFINVRRVHPDGRLIGVTLYQLDAQRRLDTVTRAASAVHAGNAWRLHKVQRSQVGADGVVTETYEELSWRTLLNPDLITVVSIDPLMLPVWELWAYVQYLQANGLEAQRYALALWSKAMLPFTVAAMVLIAVPFVFGSLRSVGMGARIMVGFLIGVAFYIVDRLAGHIGLAYGLPPALSAALPTALVLIVAIVMVRRLR